MSEKAAVSVSVLRSSSSGNSTLIWNRKHAILVDCGLGPRVTEGLLGARGFSMGDLAGVLVTHAHSDHSNPTALKNFFRRGIPIYCARGVEPVLMRELSGMIGHRFQTFSDEPFTVGSFRVTSFEVDHDSEGGCVGFSILSGDGGDAKKISLVTDCGKPGGRIAQRMLDSHLILMASNYDAEMIQTTNVVPEYIKRKHILPYQPSNDDCANVLLHVARASEVLPEAVYLLHISKNHNTIKKALARSRKVLHGAGYSQIRVLPTYRDAVSETTCL